MSRDFILRPWVVGEGISVSQAARIAGKSEDTLRRWCALLDIGRRVMGGSWKVSRPALDMVLADDLTALSAYLAGERGSVVRPYFDRLGLGSALDDAMPAKAA